ncbi:unnamed protein product [Effrenium voratum]|uniref:Uncharacterized protein n=1 Tax=Effrenium voratum TaxID=2562239 RepID=A0AA36NHX3_9DINO|nr:unnamed protein product [Effrenium voratum]CAJ1428031.1 unnamed protein product [Effrenium voratum]CAJ1444825.1 unnamed protein product [Effrenium voratum]
MFARVFILAAFPFAAAKGLRGITDVACSGTGLPKAPACYGGSLLVETFHINVLSVDGNVGVVDLKADGAHEGQCNGAQFQHNEGAITIENDSCGLSDLAGYDYTVQYCSDQDHLIVNLVKPVNVRVVLESQTCPPAGEV